MTSNLRSAGIRSCWSSPIRSAEGRALGVVCVLLSEARSPEPPEARVADRAAVLAAIVIERLEAESSSRNDQTRLQMALEAGRMGTWDWDIRSGQVWWSENVARIHGVPEVGCPPKVGPPEMEVPR